MSERKYRNNINEEITNGDKVKIDYEDWTTYLEAVIINMPRGNGDLLQIKTNDNIVMAINPCYYKLRTIEKIKPNKESE